MFLICLQISQESTCVGVFFKKVAGPQNFNLVKKRLHHRSFSREFSELFKSTYFAEDLWTAGSETSVLLYEKSFFKEHLQWLLLTVSGFQTATLFFKRDSGKDVCLWVLQNFQEYLPTEHIRMTASVNFEKLFRSLVI